ncbi:hypothetical protein LJB88_01265 [Erysipelotrichaceae bacterium OttesenSCG-928-M19]|nr:hypothetical protein [Erysipelotrichaceae bacterium OttesenSCG-928-M19]
MKNYFALALSILSLLVFILILLEAVVYIPAFLPNSDNGGSFYFPIFAEITELYNMFSIIVVLANLVMLLLYAILVYCCFKAYSTNRKGFLVYPIIMFSINLLVFIGADVFGAWLDTFIIITNVLMLILAILGYLKATKIKTLQENNNGVELL